MEEFWLVRMPNAPTVSMTYRIPLTQGQGRMVDGLFHHRGLTSSMAFGAPLDHRRLASQLVSEHDFILGSLVRNTVLRKR